MSNTDCSYPTEPLVFQKNHPVFSGNHDPMVKNEVTFVPWPREVTKYGFTLRVWACYSREISLCLQKKLIFCHLCVKSHFGGKTQQINWSNMSKAKSKPTFSNFLKSGNTCDLIFNHWVLFSREKGVVPLENKWFRWVRTVCTYSVSNGYGLISFLCNKWKN